mmetsp:Transcript_17316/g.40239  ORF Transcript_17316/g.40239 Transcript_17316/m.40239 type:complete len:238 (+) Transcript_17316:3483-4196(+)
MLGVGHEHNHPGFLSRVRRHAREGLIRCVSNDLTVGSEFNVLIVDHFAHPRIARRIAKLIHSTLLPDSAEFCGHASSVVSIGRHNRHAIPTVRAQQFDHGPDLTVLIVGSDGPLKIRKLVGIIVKDGTRGTGRNLDHRIVGRHETRHGRGSSRTATSDNAVPNGCCCAIVVVAAAVVVADFVSTMAKNVKVSLGGSGFVAGRVRDLPFNPDGCLESIIQEPVIVPPTIGMIINLCKA